MKGIVFTVFNRLVEEKFGLEMWEEILDRVHPASEGIYTTGDTYPAEELFALTNELSKITKTSRADMLRTFGEYALPVLVRLFSDSAKKGKTAKQFIQNVEKTVHLEVKKLYPDAELPTFTCEDPSPNQLVILYKSPRKLCQFAEGLIDGTGKYFGVVINRTQTLCLLKGDNYCRFELRFEVGQD